MSVTCVRVMSSTENSADTTNTMIAKVCESPQASGEPMTNPSRPPARCRLPHENVFVSAAMTTSMIEHTDHSSIAQPAMTRGLPDPLPALRMRRTATRTSNTGTTMLITPNRPAANACSTRPSAPSTRNHSDPMKNTASTIITKHNPSRRYAGSNSPVPPAPRTPAPSARGTASAVRFHHGSSVGAPDDGVCRDVPDELVRGLFGFEEVDRAITLKILSQGFHLASRAFAIRAHQCNAPRWCCTYSSACMSMWS